jgi:hypothetical protein
MHWPVTWECSPEQNRLAPLPGTTQLLGCLGWIGWIGWLGWIDSLSLIGWPGWLGWRGSLGWIGYLGWIGWLGSWPPSKLRWAWNSDRCVYLLSSKFYLRTDLQLLSSCRSHLHCLLICYVLCSPVRVTQLWRTALATPERSLNL